tara:strand:+ start:1267 stop:3021 length:1755 start_codon:yes stop_codon:yes gene_type:complete
MKKTGNIVDWILLKRVLKYSNPYKKKLFYATLSAILLAILGPLRPWLINFAIDNYIIVSNIEMLAKATLLLFLMLFAEGFFQFYYMFLSTWIGQNVIRDIRSQIFQHIISMRMKYFDNTQVGTLVTRTISDIETISDIFSQGLLVIIAELLKLILVLVFMFYTSFKLTIVTLITIPFLLIATAWFKRNIKSAFQDVRTQVSKLNAFVQERIIGMKIVQIFNKEESEFNNFKEINIMHRDANIRSIFYYAVFFPIVEILSALAIALVIWSGSISIIKSSGVTIGELVAFILYIYMMFRPIRQLADRFNVLQMGIVGSERVFKILDTDQKITNDGKLKFDGTNGNISFENVSFYYKNKQWVLKNINFFVENNKTLALIGHTGSGKTSIANLILKFYESQRGKILIGNNNIESYTLNSLRKSISYVQQEVFLFSDTIMNNVKMYDNTIKNNDVEKAAKELGIHDFITSLPNSYEYILGERGITLSVGQRQLIAFLRVYIRNPKIIILDEATSSIDSESEELLQAALKKMSINRTIIIIAHRLSTITGADKIILLEKGNIIESGNHQTLIDLNGKYFEMYSKQKNMNL